MRFLSKFALVKKSLLLICLSLVCCASLYAQQRDELRLISSSHSRLNASTGNMMNYRPVYEHHGSTLSADSGYIYSDEEEKQYFDAFGKVIITQPNGTVIFADKLHYVAETQLATLTNNVRMVDGNSTLTTNHLTYNMQNGVGTYTSGGRILNETDTITSRNATYFDNTKDAYFRYDVVVRTPDVKIYTDTMRYNSVSKITYFYGPTNIKGNDGENLYTERGEYNTETENAWFDRNNLYTSGSRFLQGDSLFYNGQTGNGRAVDNVVFIDTADQFFAYGGIGLYHRIDESITMTEQPLVMTVTRNDSTNTSSMPADSLNTADTLQTDTVQSDSLARTPIDSPPATDTIYMTADTLFSQVIPLKDYVPKVFELDREGGALDEYEDEEYGEDFEDFTIPDSLADTPPVVPDSSAAPPADTSAVLPVDSNVAIVDSIPAEVVSQTDAEILKTHLKRVESVPLQTSVAHDLLARNLSADSVLRAHSTIPTGGEVDSLMAGAVAALARPPKDTLTMDSLARDTARTRIIEAYYNVRLFKSDLQAVADSVYYGYPDSMMRFFGRPMIWAQGSQMTADTIFMQIRKEQLDNMLLVNNAFMVNTQLDSSKYNQIKGRRITGFFKDNALERMFIDGNAESIYYTVDEKQKTYTYMYHNRSSRIKVLLDSNQITYFIPIRNIDSKVHPLSQIPQEEEILEGFVWKPGDRPISKEDLLTRRRPPADAETKIPADSTGTADTSDTSDTSGRMIPAEELIPEEDVMPDTEAETNETSAVTSARAIRWAATDRPKLRYATYGLYTRPSGAGAAPAGFAGRLWARGSPKIVQAILQPVYRQTPDKYR